jgi:hypothetical protein
MNGISFFKKIKMFLFFTGFLKKNKSDLERIFNIRIDYANRMYTVLNIPEELIGEPYNIRKSDIDKICEKFIKDYSMNLSSFLNKNGLGELYEFYEIKKVDKYSYLIVIGYSMFRTNLFYNRIYFVFTPLILTIFAILLIYFI